MKMTLDELAPINFFSPLDLSFHLSYSTTFSDQVCISRLHCSAHFRSLPVDFFLFRCTLWAPRTVTGYFVFWFYSPFLRNKWTSESDFLYSLVPFFSMKMTLDELVAINFFSPLGISFHLRYCTTFSDQIFNLRFHSSPHFRLLPVKFVYFSALPGLKKQGLGILFVNFRPHLGVKREHTYIQRFVRYI